MVYACWWYYFSKFTEFFDTVSILIIYRKMSQKKNTKTMELNREKRVFVFQHGLKAVI